ncbi:MAG: trimethylamine methyltransferase, partial [Gammaproteobacteria bacterium]|nr:trimethylamine methyltransferase [Gammaproteobacteria bacterium]
PAVWQEKGAKDHWQRARQRVTELLQHHPQYLDKVADQAIRQNYPILDTIAAL